VLKAKYYLVSRTTDAQLHPPVDMTPDTPNLCIHSNKPDNSFNLPKAQRMMGVRDHFLLRDLPTCIKAPLSTSTVLPNTNMEIFPCNIVESPISAEKHLYDDGPPELPRVSTNKC